MFRSFLEQKCLTALPKGAALRQQGDLKLPESRDAVCDWTRPHPACLDGAHDGALAAVIAQSLRPHPHEADGV